MYLQICLCRKLCACMDCGGDIPQAKNKTVEKDKYMLVHMYLCTLILFSKKQPCGWSTIIPDGRAFPFIRLHHIQYIGYGGDSATTFLSFSFTQ